MKNKKTALILALLLMMPSLALAQEEWGFSPGDWELTIQGSGTSDDDIDNTVASMETSLGYFFTKGFELGLRQGVLYSDPDTGSDRWNASTRAFADYHFDLGRLRPFLGVNFGYLYGDDVEETFIAGPEVGLKYFVQRKAFLYLLGEYNFTFEDSDDIEDNYEDGRFVYALGLGVNW